MEQSKILLLAALVGALLSIGPAKTRVFAVIAAVVAAIALTLSLGVLHISLPHVNLVVFAALAGLGVLLVLKIDQKMRVVAATIVACVGALGVLQEVL